MSIFFKNKTLRDDERVYDVVKQNANPNQFGAIPNYESVDRKLTTLIMRNQLNSPIKERMHNISSCTLENECSLEKRRKTREQLQLNYNSVLKVGQSYFTKRGLSQDVQNIDKLGNKYKMIQDNITAKGRKTKHSKVTTVSSRAILENHLYQSSRARLKKSPSIVEKESIDYIRFNTEDLTKLNSGEIENSFTEGMDKVR